MKVFLDITKGELRTALNLSPIRLLRMYRGNVLPLEVVLSDSSGIVTSTVLTGEVSLRLAIAGYQRGADPLIEQDTFEVSGDVATGTVDLTADALTDYFENFVPSSAEQWPFKLEIQAVNSGGTFRQTYYSGQMIICREVIPFSIHAPQAITDNSGAAITDNSGNAITSN